MTEARSVGGLIGGSNRGRRRQYFANEHGAVKTGAARRGGNRRVRPQATAARDGPAKTVIVPVGERA